LHGFNNEGVGFLPKKGFLVIGMIFKELRGGSIEGRKGRRTNNKK